MKNHPYYLYTAIGFVILYTLLAFTVVPFITRVHIENNLDRDIEAARQEATIFKVMSESVIDSLERSELRERFQKSITATDNQVIFNSILDWSGKYIAYPDQTEIGKSPLENNALQLDPQEELNGKILREFVYEESSSHATSAIILLTPVGDSDWIIGSHINKARVQDQATYFKNRVYGFIAIIGLITLLFVLTSLLVVSRYYEKLVALKSAQLEDGVLNLSKLNTSLETYQKSLSQSRETLQNISSQIEDENASTAEDVPSSKNTKQRIITYVRNEILSIRTEDISYIYVENTITYVVRKDGKRSTTGESLDLIYSYLDPRFFFRVNRQIIVAISAIETIIKFGNSKLKIQVSPVSEVDIIIGKNKAASFKQWLDL
jgi:hypothetical protein